MSVNKVILYGNVGKDPEVRYLDNNVSVANFTIATTERGFTSKNGTEVPEKTEWHNIVAWRGLSTLAEKYIRKGMKLYVEGKIRTRTWEDNGVRKYITEIFADTIELPKRDGDVAPLAMPEVKTTATPNPTPAPIAHVEEETTTDDLPF